MVKLRRSFTWSLVGNLGYNLTQWLLVVALARLGTSHMVGQFALAQAISAPVFLMVGLNLRAVRATDVRRVWTAEQYRVLRLVLNAGSLALTIGIGLATGMRGTTLWVLVIVALAKSAEATSQLLYGYFQIRTRLDLVSRSFLLRAALGAAGFLAALVATGGLPEACLGLLVGWLLVYVVHDRPAERRLLADEDANGSPDHGSGTLVQLARKAFPLGVDAGVGSLANNVPRYSVQAQLGTAQLGTYAALAYLGQVSTMLTGAMADALIARLAVEADRRDARAFRRSMNTLLTFGMSVSAVVVVGAWLLGEPVIRLLLGPTYVNQSLLVWLMVAAAMTTLQRCLGRGLQAAHRYTAVLVIDTLTLLVTMAAVPPLVASQGVAGAGVGVAIAFAAGAVVAGWVLHREVARMREVAPTTAVRMTS
jgi:O-antigen/teichoic acid export membrane protein